MTDRQTDLLLRLPSGSLLLPPSPPLLILLRSLLRLSFADLLQLLLAAPLLILQLITCTRTPEAYTRAREKKRKPTSLGSNRFDDTVMLRTSMWPPRQLEKPTCRISGWNLCNTTVLSGRSSVHSKNTQHRHLHTHTRTQEPSSMQRAAAATRAKGEKKTGKQAKQNKENTHMLLLLKVKIILLLNKPVAK